MGHWNITILIYKISFEEIENNLREKGPQQMNTSHKKISVEDEQKTSTL